MQDDKLTYPPRHYVRRGELIHWLGQYEYKPGRCYTAKVVRRLINQGVIVGHRLSIYKRQAVYVPREVSVQLGLGELVPFE